MKSHAALEDVKGLHVERAEVVRAAEDVEDEFLDVERSEAGECKMVDSVRGGEGR